MKLVYRLICFIGLMSWCLLGFGQQQEVDLANEYYQSGQYEKAADLYSKIIRNEEYLSKVHRQYLDALLRLKETKTAGKYLKKIVKSQPNNPVFVIDYGRFLCLYEDSVAGKKLMTDYTEKVSEDAATMRYAVNYFVEVRLYEYAEKCFVNSRKNTGEKFYADLAELYYLWQRPQKMIEQYLAIVDEDENQQEYVQIALQDRLKDEAELQMLERVLYDNVQKSPDKIVYNELLLWYLVQRKEYTKAFVQVKALDKRQRMEGFKILDLGKHALDNAAYQDAIKIFEHLVEKFQGKSVFLSAKNLLIKSKEGFVKNTYPVDIEKIRSLASDYQQLLDENGIKVNTAEVVRSLALLQAFYLNELDASVKLLLKLISLPALPHQISSQAKLDLGDIYLLKGEPEEASLTYSQVEKAQKEQDLGHQAKLRNAKLWYYTGNFGLAKSHLNILKLATSREIANDALQLALLIQDNLELDTTETVMRLYASAELLVFQKHYDEALLAYERIIQAFSGHSLTDEIWWQQALIYQKIGKFEQAIVMLEKILADYRTDILADDANYLIAMIYEENLHHTEKAMEYYKKQLTDFQGSVFNVDARRRFRKLRGDAVN